MEDDEIIFELSFQSEAQQSQVTQIADEKSGGFGEDACRCTLTIDTSDTRFWKATMSDGYYNCNNTQAGNICDGDNDWDADNLTVETSEHNDWEIPPNFDDEDYYDETNRWCTSANVEGEEITGL